MKRAKLNSTLKSILFSKDVDSLQFTKMYQHLQDCMKKTQIADAIIKNIAEFCTGNVLKCYLCQDGDNISLIHFLPGDNLDINGELSIANHKCDNGDCEEIFNAFKCTKPNCETTWLMEASLPQRNYERLRHIICKKFLEKK